MAATDEKTTLPLKALPHLKQNFINFIKLNAQKSSALFRGLPATATVAKMATIFTESVACDKSIADAAISCGVWI